MNKTLLTWIWRLWWLWRLWWIYWLDFDDFDWAKSSFRLWNFTRSFNKLTTLIAVQSCYFMFFFLCWLCFEDISAVKLVRCVWPTFLSSNRFSTLSSSSPDQTYIFSNLAAAWAEENAIKLGFREILGFFFLTMHYSIKFS